MGHKELTVTGFHKGCDQEKLFDYIANQEGLTLIVTEGCPDFLVTGVNKVARMRSTSVKPSVVWQELIEVGARELLTKWKSSDNTNVPKAVKCLYTTMRDAHEMLYRMVESFDSHSAGECLGNQAVIILSSALYLDDWEDEDEADVEQACDMWGLDFGDFCFLAAAIAGEKVGIDSAFQPQLEKTEKYLREKVWLINVLVKAGSTP